MSAQLVAPDPAYQDSYLEALAEFQAEGRYQDLLIGDLAADFGGFARRLIREADPAFLRPGWVPHTVLWLVEGATYIGRVSIRHMLNDWLRTYGGHIGYDIRPSWRRRGHGTQILRLALPHARALGLPRVLITCHEDNLGSRKIIEHNGGQYKSSVPSPDDEPTPMRRYWIDLD